MVIRNIVNPGRSGEGRDNRRDDVIDVDAAENLFGQINSIRLAVPHPVECRTVGTVYPRKAKNADIFPQVLPGEIGVRPCGAATLADGRAFIDPRAFGIAIDTCG